MRISDWSSDVCASDLIPTQPIGPVPEDAVEVAYEPCDWAPAEDGRISEALYEGYGLQSIRIPNAKPHPTRLVQSAAMARSDERRAGKECCHTSRSRWSPYT